MEKNHCFAILLLVFGFVEVYSSSDETETTDATDSGNVLLKEDWNLDPFSETLLWSQTLARSKRDKLLTPEQRKALDEKRQNDLRIATIRARREREERERIQQEAREREEDRRAMNQNNRLDREMRQRWEQRK